MMIAGLPGQGSVVTAQAAQRCLYRVYAAYTSLTMEAVCQYIEPVPSKLVSRPWVA